MRELFDGWTVCRGTRVREYGRREEGGQLLVTCEHSGPGLTGEWGIELWDFWKVYCRLGDYFVCLQI